MTSKEIRQKFMDFFQMKEHAIIPSASLVPSEVDPTALFTTAGMQPLVPYLLGEKHPKGNRLANAQKCIRTGDIDEVGDSCHLTFFEMLGNWSLGDYFKKEAIEMSWEFLVSPDWLSLDPKRIAVSVFAGDEDAPFDEEAFEVWGKVGMPEERIAKLGKKENWWGPAGLTGPCGPDTEIFYWIAESEAPKKFNPEDKNWVEIWNNVFMQYNKNSEGKYEPLAQKNIDTGMGLERLAMIMQEKNDVYETDLFAPIVAKIKSQISNFKNDDEKSIRIIADHIKASVFIIADGVEPSNSGAGYVLRRLIRRAVRYGKLLNIESGKWMVELAKIVIDIYKDIYPEVLENKNKIFDELSKEEEKFGQTLEKGLKELEKIGQKVSGKEAFALFSTYGFPLEMIKEIAKEVDEEEFQEEMKKHQELSKTASAGMFKGGLADASEETTRLHTTAHLLLSALREVLGEKTYQKGSNITPERLRFDFNYPKKLTDEQKQKVEDLVNEKIKENLSVIREEMSLEKAKEKGATGVFDSKYGEQVKVYSIGDFSKEICGGPHTESTGSLGRFKITKESSSSAGVRRIKAVLE